MTFLLGFYLGGIVFSWILVSGWVYADQPDSRGFAAGWSVLAALYWPFFVPFFYRDTKGAASGWVRVWKKKPCPHCGKTA